MKRSILFSVLLASLSLAALAQQNNIWTFGHNAGLDFNNGTAVAITDSMITESACASVASRSGDLLFYTNGETIWDRNHAVMPNGTGLSGDPGSALLQGALIIPFLNDTNKYYVFSMKDFATSGLDDLYYSVVDLSLNNGLGDVVATQKNVWVQSGNGSALAAIPGNDCNIWLVTHWRETNIFKTFEITAAGINLAAPVMSTTGAWSGIYAYETSVMKVAPNMQQLALSNFTIASYGSTPSLNMASSLELFDFDRSTGQVSNGQKIDETMVFFFNFLSLEFSPDGTKLYSAAPFLTFYAMPSVYQYDLTQPTLAAIQSSKTAVGSPMLVGDIRRAPDGKVYVAASFGLPATTLDRIDDPNLAGTACNYMPAALALETGTYATTLFPTPVVYPVQDTFYNVRDTFICSGGTLSLPVPAGYFYYTFQGAPLTDTILNFNTAGTYWLTYSNYCEWGTDTFHIRNYELDAGIRDTALCGNTFELTLNATSANPPGTQYSWQDGSQGPSFIATHPGTYWVSMDKDGCVETDSMTISELPFPAVNLGPDTSICLGDTILLQGPAADSYLWQDGSTGRDYTVTNDGVYTLMASANGCPGKDTITVSSTDCACRIFVPNAFSPNGDGLNDDFSPQLDCGPINVHYQINIFNKWGQRVFYSNKITNSWNGTYKGTNVETGTYFYRIEYQDTKNGVSVQKGDITLLR
jgi:gliding motility-associated-like protein